MAGRPAQDDGRGPWPKSSDLDTYGQEMITDRMDAILGRKPTYGHIRNNPEETERGYDPLGRK